MRRELLIAAAVLVPFAVLVAAGFSFSPAPQLPLPEPVKEKSPLPHGGEGQGEGIAHLDAGTTSAPPELPPELAAPLKAVLPEVRQCFLDQHLEHPHQVKVRFTPTRDGGFERVEVDEQNPFLAACLEDVFAEVTWHPSGRETWAPATHTFSFDPSPD